ncbi:MAG: arginine--tRNA ligase [Myxococcota bacterium]
MKIEDIDTRLEQLKDEALAELDVPEDVAAEISIETPPNPDMGDRGFPCFVLARELRNAPPKIAADVAEVVERLLEDSDIIESVDPVGPYVNVTFDRAKLARLVVSEALDTDAFGAETTDEQRHWMFEYSAPNTNKPQHLGHVRNDLLGQSVATIVDFAGHEVTRVNLINDRGIHICKSMLAYKKWGEGETPESAGVKGDHLVGKYYVLFNVELNDEYAQWQQTDEAEKLFQKWCDEREEKTAEEFSNEQLREIFFGQYSDDYFNEQSELGAEAREMLRDWEAGDEDVVELWETMNQWVFDGFDETYERLGVEFDKVYYESDTYKLGKDIVEEGLEKGVLHRLDDGAVACDLEQIDMPGEKILLRSDGTSVYMTQDLGTAVERFREYDMDEMVYVVGNEQDYHFQVLFGILGLLRPELKGRLEHLSYGMVLLPEGKMKSREGKVVDADQLMDEMIELASDAVRERYDDLDEDEIARRSEAIGMGALKYFIMDFNPRSTVNFDPAKSIDFQGRTGPYCMYSYARIQSIGRELGGWPELDDAARDAALSALGTDLEMGIVRELQTWPSICSRAARELDPSKVTEHLFKLCKSFSTLYNDQDHRIKDLDGARRDGLLLLSKAVARTLDTGLELIGVETLEEM